MDHLWLKAQFEFYPDKNKADLARAIGLEPPAISKILGGKRQIKAHEYIGMRKFFGLPTDGARALSKPSASYTLEPLAQNMQENDGEGWTVPAALFKDRTRADPNQIKIFTVQDNAMEPEFRAGEPVVVDISSRVPSPPGIFVVSDGFGHMARQCEFIPNSKPPKVKLSAHSVNFQPQTLKLSEFKIIGRVIARLQWV